MVPTEIRVYPLSKIKEKVAFGTIEKAEEYFCNDLPYRDPPGRFNIPSIYIEFKKGSLILFQYAEKKNEEKIIAHAKLLSDGCISDALDDYYIGYYLIDVESINFYRNAITKEEIIDIWDKKLSQAKLNLDVAKYEEYMELLKRKKNIKSKCQ